MYKEDDSCVEVQFWSFCEGLFFILNINLLKEIYLKKKYIYIYIVPALDSSKLGGNGEIT